MLKELKTHHRKICQLSFDGYKPAEIAEKLDMNPSTINTILRSNLAKAYINGMLDRVDEASLDVRQRLIKMNSKALDSLDRILSKDTKAPYAVQATMIKDVLDRNGYKAPEKHQVDMTFQHKSDEEIDAEIAAMEADIERAQAISNTDSSED